MSQSAAMTFAEWALAPDDMKPENILAMRDVFQTYGRYTS